LPPERRAERAHLDEIGPVAGAEGLAIVPIRIRFEIESFGVNGYSASAGGRVIEEHDELSAGAGRHEELYFVAEGHARFTLDGEEVDAPAGTFVFVSDPKVRRGAVAAGERTTVLVVGGVPGRPFQPSPWEAWLEAAPFLDAGEPERGAEILERALAVYPGNPNVLYNLACLESRAGRTEAALSHLAEAVERDPRTRDWAQTDSDLDSIRSDPRFPAAG
jgi:quercetin dioxygenase-like cupin family protein